MRAKLAYFWVLTFVLLCMIACNGAMASKESTAGETERVSTDTSETDASQENLTETMGSQQMIYASVIPMTFEEYVANASNIVRAKYLGARVEGNLAYLSFEPLSQIEGQIEEETFNVVRRLDTVYYSTTGEYRYTGDYSRYVVGEEYLLVLEKHVSVYYDCDRYYVLGDIFIPKTLDAGATMLGYEELAQFVTAEENITSTYSEICDYIEEIAKENPGKSEYVESTDLQDIVEGSTYIFKVKVEKYEGGAESNNTERFYCTVSEQLKGIPDGDRVLIIFVADTVEIGSEYIVLLDKVDETAIFYVLSSKNSVYPVSDTESIAVIKDALKGDHVTE